MLQFGAFVSLLMQQCGYRLNVKTQEGLTRLKLLISISFIVIVWTRVIRYAWLIQIVLARIWEDQNWIVIKCAYATCILLSLVNAVLVLQKCTKFLKFVPKNIKKYPMENAKNLAKVSDSAGIYLKTTSFARSKAFTVLITRSKSYAGLTMSQKNFVVVRKGVVNMF